MAKDKDIKIFEKAEVIDAGSEGMAVCRVDNRVIFVPFVVPGDVIDIRIVRRKKNFLEGRVVYFHGLSEKRVEPLCSHFGTCGGCRWQNMAYDDQLFYKQKQVYDSMKRIGGIDSPRLDPICGSDHVIGYRNKLEYTFSSRRWFTELNSPEDPDKNALGFHVPGMFDKVLDIDHCYLQDNLTNKIRLKVREYAVREKLEFYDIRTHQGFLRNLITRSTLDGRWMVIMVFARHLKMEIKAMMSYIRDEFPQITSLLYIINEKLNDTISDLEPVCFHGDPFITENMGNISFRISPVSFFQTNTLQAKKLYDTAIGLAGFSENDHVYDLYSGTGTISLLAAGKARKVTGIEYVEAAVNDARLNAELNGIKNAFFFAGDIAKILNDDFILKNEKPDIVITDPPRAGMHNAVVEKIMQAAPSKIVYVSCNPATQARDIALMTNAYQVSSIHPFDMFPHTQHVENIVLLERM